MDSLQTVGLLTQALGNQTGGTTVAAPVGSSVEPLTSHGEARRLGEALTRPLFPEPEESMNPPPAALSKDVTRAHQEIRAPELGPASKRDRLVQRVLAARKRLPQIPRSSLVKIR